MITAEVEFGEEQCGFRASLGDGDAGLEAAESVMVLPSMREPCRDDGGEDIDLGAGCEDGAEVEAAGQDADDGGGVSVESRAPCR